MKTTTLLCILFAFATYAACSSSSGNEDASSTDNADNTDSADNADHSDSDDDGDNGSSVGNSEPLTCEEVCTNSPCISDTGLFQSDECLEVCNGLSPDTQRSFRFCLQSEADEDEAIDEYCDQRRACLPTLGACYWQCNDSGQCRDGATMTETECASQAELDCGGSPEQFTYTPDCPCGEESSTCRTPEWYVLLQL